MNLLGLLGYVETILMVIISFLIGEEMDADSYPLFICLVLAMSLIILMACINNAQREKIMSFKEISPRTSLGNGAKWLHACRHSGSTTFHLFSCEGAFHLPTKAFYNLKNRWTLTPRLSWVVIMAWAAETWQLSLLSKAMKMYLASLVVCGWEKARFRSNRNGLLIFFDLKCGEIHRTFLFVSLLFIHNRFQHRVRLGLLLFIKNIAHCHNFIKMYPFT